MSLGLFLLFILSVGFVWVNETRSISPFRLSRAALVSASVCEGEFRDSGLVQLAFAECDQSQVLIVGRLSQRDGEPGGFR